MGKTASLMFNSETADANILNPYEVQQISSAVDLSSKALHLIFFNLTRISTTLDPCLSLLGPQISIETEIAA